MNPPPYQQFPELKGNIISLKQINDDDIHEIIEISFYDGILASTYDEAKAMLDKINHDYSLGNSVHWAIVANDNNKILGTCGYYRGFEQGTGELGCVLLSKYRGNGYMTMALELAISYGKKDMGLTKIIAITTIQNHKAIQLLERLNFVKIYANSSNNEIMYEWHMNDEIIVE